MDHPPFEPTERNTISMLAARWMIKAALDGSQALEALMQANGGKLPINVKVLIEGEEEVGGESIANMCGKRKPS